jgi:hypothetical protein
MPRRSMTRREPRLCGSVNATTSSAPRSSNANASPARPISVAYPRPHRSGRQVVGRGGLSLVPVDGRERLEVGWVVHAPAAAGTDRPPARRRPVATAPARRRGGVVRRAVDRRDSPTARRGLRPGVGGVGVGKWLAHDRTTGPDPDRPCDEVAQAVVVVGAVVHHQVGGRQDRPTRRRRACPPRAGAGRGRRPPRRGSPPRGAPGRPTPTPSRRAPSRSGAASTRSPR